MRVVPRTVAVLVSLSVAGLIPMIPATAAAHEDSRLGTQPDEGEADPTAAVADPSVKANEHFQRGVALYQEGDFESALFEFKTAYETAPTYRMLYNIGVTQLELHDYASAKTSLERYLEDGAEEITGERRTAVEEQIAKLGERVGVLVVTTTPPGAAVRVGTKIVGESPVELPANIGSVTVEIVLDGYRTISRSAAIIGGEETRVDVQLEAITFRPGTGTTPDGDQPPTDTAGPRVQRLLLGTWISLAFGVAFGAGATATGLFAFQARQDFNDELNQSTTQPALDDAHARAQNLGYATDGLIGAAAIAGATALGLGITAIVVRKRSRTTDGTRARTGKTIDFGASPWGFALRF